MAQLSIFEKQRHHSHKDFTCSVGKLDRVYMTFRNGSWRRFTQSNYIRIYVKDRVIKFGDPGNIDEGGIVLKLKKTDKGYESTRESTRYVQIEGKKYPAILEIIKRTAGSYDFPKEQTKEEVKAEKAQLSEMSAEAIKSRIAQAKKEAPTSEKLAEEHRPDLKRLAEIFASERPVIMPLDVPKTLAQQFIEDAERLTKEAKTPEERTAIYNALAEIYRLQCQSTYPLTKWDIP